ncbi:MAG: hypothetical protein ACMUHB_00070 [Thermoplasmatota archaeon]
MQYCPNCSAFQYDQGAKRCSKCGFDFSSYDKPAPKKDGKAKEKPSPDLSRFDESEPCRICGSPTKEVHGTYEMKVEGGRMSIYGIKLMGGEITKKPSTLFTFEIEGRECSEGHQFFKDFEHRSRALCPVCYDPMMRYGSSLYSCSRCNKHFPVQSWPEPDPVEVLMDKGWEEL